MAEVRKTREPDGLPSIEEDLRWVRRLREKSRRELQELIDRTYPMTDYSLPNVLQGKARYVALARLIGALAPIGLLADEQLALLLMVNARRCLPPLPEEDLVRLAWRIQAEPRAAA